MPKLIGRICDKQTGEAIEARVQVLSSGGTFLHPADAILKVGPGLPFFYADGEFEVNAPRGVTRILVERGTEYTPAVIDLDLAARGVVPVEIELDRWSKLGAMGWHPGNTHIHYDQHETRPDERLRLDPRIEDLRVTAISILTRGDLPYASNKYPPGMLTEFSSAHHHVECGEESRHNQTPWEMGYGHVMLLRIQEIVEPVSRGVLVSEGDPDYPPLCYVCDGAHRQGGIVIWCHNGSGMEAPVATALGKLDAFNLFDPYWKDPEYDLWYAMLNCGFKLPASTGSDWYICSANRVYAYTGAPFAYPDWVTALQDGRTFITNGPALHLAVHGPNAENQMPGDTIRCDPGTEIRLSASWDSHYPVERVEIVWNGRVIAGRNGPPNRNGEVTTRFTVPSDGWVAARIAGFVRDSFHQPIYAHTSPVYVHTGTPPAERPEAAALFDRSIEAALEWVNTKGRFTTDAQRREVVTLFREGQEVYRRLKV
jgi:TolB protein